MKKRVACVAVLCICIFTALLAGCSNVGEVKDVPQKYVQNWSKADAFDISDYPVVIKDPDRAFKVLQITDVHYDWHNDKKAETLSMIDALIESESPDMIALTGDWTSDRDVTKESSETVFSTIDRHGVPWAPVFGNHDSEGALTKYDYADLFEKYENCLFRTGPSNIKGVGNYIVNVREGGTDGKLVQSMVMLDSHMSIPIDTTNYDSIGKDQIAWYAWAVNGLNGVYGAQSGNGSAVIPSLAFFHICLPEYKNYKKAIGTQDWVIGGNREGNWPPKKNTGLFAQMKASGSTKGVFVGHDHDNNAAFYYKGILLAYGVETGWCKEYATQGQKGGAVIEFKNDGSIFLTHRYYDMNAMRP